MEIYVDDEAKLTLHGLVQHYVMLNEDQKNRKLNDLLDALDFNQVRGRCGCVCGALACVCGRGVLGCCIYCYGAGHSRLRAARRAAAAGFM